MRSASHRPRPFVVASVLAATMATAAGARATRPMPVGGDAIAVPLPRQNPRLPPTVMTLDPEGDAVIVRTHAPTPRAPKLGYVLTPFGGVIEYAGRRFDLAAFVAPPSEERVEPKKARVPLGLPGGTPSVVLVGFVIVVGGLVWDTDGVVTVLAARGRWDGFGEVGRLEL